MEPPSAHSTKSERKKRQQKAKGKKSRYSSKNTAASQIISPSNAATEDLREPSALAAPSDITSFVSSADETGRSDMMSPPRPSRRRSGRRHHLESTRDQKEQVSSSCPRPKRIEVSAGPSTPREFRHKSSTEDGTRPGRRGQLFAQTLEGKQATRFRKKASGERAVIQSPGAVRRIQSDTTAVDSSQLDLTRGSSGINLTPNSADEHRGTNVAPLAKKRSGQSMSEGESFGKDDGPGIPADAKGHSTPPCNPSLGRSYRSEITRGKVAGQPAEHAAAGNVSAQGEEEEESFCEVTSAMPAETALEDRAMPMSDTSTSSDRSKQIPRSIGQSWISQVSREMAGCLTPRKDAILALLKKGMTRKTPGDVAKEAPAPVLPEETQPYGKLSSITWTSEGMCEPTPAVGGPPAFTTTVTALSKEKETAVKVKETRSVHIAKTVDNLDVSDVPRVSLRRDSRPRRVLRAPKPKENVFGASSKHLMIPVLVIPVLIIFAFLIAFIVRKTPARPRKVRFPEQLAAACEGSTACIRAVRAMAESLDLAADPCSEFDRFACAKWRSLDLNRRSYQRESAHNYTQSIGEALQRIYDGGSERQRSGDVDNGTVSMATFYSSCRAFLDANNSQVANTSDVINVMGLDQLSLDNATAQTDLQSLLEFAVGSSFKSGLPSFVSVTLRGDKTFLDIGETLHSTLGPSKLVEQFLHSTLRSEDDTFLDALYHVDLSANEWRSRGKPGPFTMTLVAHLQVPFTGASWADALNKGLPADGASYSPDSMVFARGIGQVVEIMSILSDDNLTMHHALVYASAVLLAQVLKYDPFFRKQPDDRRAAATESVETCLTVTGTYFKDLLPRWITATLVSNERMRAFKTMVKHLQANVVHSSQGARRMAIDGSEFSKLNVTIIGERALTEYSWASRVPLAPTGASGDQFILNVVRASRAQVGADYEEGVVEQQLRGDLKFSQLGEEQSVVVVPASFLVADTLIADDKVPSIDYAAVGVRLLLNWALATRASTMGADQSATLERGIQCVRNTASKLFGRNVGYGEGQLLAFADWALDVAWTAAESHRRHPTGGPVASSLNGVIDDGSPGLRISRQFFYLRFCHTLCGERGSLAGACRYRTASSHDFTRAFGCSEPPLLRC